MAGQKEYRHITVNPAEEDDVVIHAGAALQQDAQPEGHDSEDAGQRINPGAQAVEASGASSHGSSEAAGSEPAQTSRKTPAAADGYTGTTLEDIEESRMPRTQVVVIVLAVLAIAAFAVWYAFFS